MKEVEDEQSKYGNIDDMWAPKQDGKPSQKVTGGTFDFDMFGMPSNHVVKKAEYINQAPHANNNDSLIDLGSGTG